ncbi:hypothetical protein BC826DRAFT_575905 [Russula brevipes]|nr:hypothetical protein BC826DRAFT_575905 [Russula brevipes]
MSQMHAIFGLTSMSPFFRKQQGARAGAPPQSQIPCFARAPPLHGHHLKGPSPHARGTRPPSTCHRSCWIRCPRHLLSQACQADTSRSVIAEGDRAWAENEECRGGGSREESGRSDSGVLAGKRRTRQMLNLPATLAGMTVLVLAPSPSEPEPDSSIPSSMAI